MGLQFTKNKDKTPGEKRREVVRGKLTWKCKGKMVIAQDHTLQKRITLRKCIGIFHKYFLMNAIV